MCCCLKDREKRQLNALMYRSKTVARHNRKGACRSIIPPFLYLGFVILFSLFLKPIDYDISANA